MAERLDRHLTGGDGSMPKKTDSLKIVGAFLAPSITFEDKDRPNRSRCQVMPADATYHHPLWGDITFDASFITAICDNFKKRKTQMVVDYNHGSLSEGPDNTLAAGWVVELHNEGPRGLFATVDWTDKAAKYIHNGEFKYISPEFTDDYYDKLTGEFVGPAMLAVALTNRPFLDMEPVETPERELPKAATEFAFAFKQVERQKKENKMLKKVIEILKLKEEATEVDAAAEIVALSERAALSDKLAAESKEKDKKIAKAEEDAKTLTEKVAALEQEKKLSEATDAVDKLVREGRMLPVQKEMAVSLFLKDRDLFDGFTKDLPVVVKLDSAAGSSTPPPDPKDPEASLTDMAKALMAEKKINFNEAVEQIRREQPEVYNAYQKYAFKKSAKQSA